MIKLLKKRFSEIENRCYNLKNISYKNYWWRGIKCEWETLDDFIRDMYPTYKEWLELDRMDNNWNYCKENCRWVTHAENCRNRRSNIVYEWKCLTDVCKERWIWLGMVKSRIKKWWSIEDAINIPKNKNR